MDPLKMYFLLKLVIFHCYVSVPKGRSQIKDLTVPSLQEKHQRWKHPIVHARCPGGASAKSKENGVVLPASSIQQFSTIYRYIGSITSSKKTIVCYLQLPSETHVFLIWNIPKNVITNPASESWSLSQHLDSSHSSIHPPTTQSLLGMHRQPARNWPMSKPVEKFQCANLSNQP